MCEEDQGRTHHAGARERAAGDLYEGGVGWSGGVESAMGFAMEWAHHARAREGAAGEDAMRDCLSRSGMGWWGVKGEDEMRVGVVMRVCRQAIL